VRRLILTDEQRHALARRRDTAPKAYLRERAAALLKIAAGMPAAAVARHGLLRPRQPDTVYLWLTRFESEGIAGLSLRPGRGRKPAFSPSLPG
jgi:transposase